MRSVGISNARPLLDKYGLDQDKLPATLSLALGAGQATPLQMATAYSTFANGGHRIQPYFIDQIYGFDNELLYQSNPARACASCYNKKIDALNAEQKAKDADKSTDTEDSNNTDTEVRNATAQNDRMKVIDAPTEHAEQAPRIISAKTAYDMSSMLRDVIQRGTATKARALGRSDIGGKTGTTNDFRDAWFAGFQPNVATVVWMGFDKPSILGAEGYGGKLALPIWMDFMRGQLSGMPYKWVTLDNQSDSEVKKSDTIDITDDGQKTRYGNSDKTNSDTNPVAPSTIRRAGSAQ